LYNQLLDTSAWYHDVALPEFFQETLGRLPVYLIDRQVLHDQVTIDNDPI